MSRRVALQVHPDTPCDALTGIEVEVVRPAGSEGSRRIELRFVVTGDVSALDVPNDPGSKPQRKDELWRHTCFEAFVRAGGSNIYHELNLAPSGDWACYRFADYRAGMEPELRVGDPGISASFRPGAIGADNQNGLAQAGMGTPFFVLTATLDLSATMLPLDEPWNLALSAVIVERNGNRSFWALKHHSGAPDFHHADCFALQLPAARLA